METLSYNKEILTATGEMIRLFSNISILQLHDSNGNSVSPSKARRILVPLKYANSSRILKSIMNPTGEPQEYPLISLEKTSMVIDLNRNSEIHHDMAIRTGKYNPDTHPPIPVDITFILRIYAKYPEDIDMVVGNFAPWFNTDVFVTTPHPKLEGKYLNHQVLWDGSVTWDWKTTLMSTEQDIINAVTNFTYKTELYAGFKKIGNDREGEIHNVVFNFSTPGGTDNLYPEYDESAAAVQGNVMGGFYAVPLSQDFEEYAEQIISNTTAPSALDYDPLLFNRPNDEFDSAVMNCDFNALTSAAASGADIYKRSYWPYAYSMALTSEPLTADIGHNRILRWLDEHGSLTPYGTHHPPPSGVDEKPAYLS